MFDGGVELEVTQYTTPCATIRDSFRDLAFNRIKQALHPGDSRVYARVLRAGQIRVGETLTVTAADAEPAPTTQGN